MKLTGTIEDAKLCLQTTSALLGVQAVINSLQTTIADHLILGEREIFTAPELQMVISKMHGHNLGGEILSVGASTIRMSTGVDYGECVIVKVRTLSHPFLV